MSTAIATGPAAATADHPRPPMLTVVALLVAIAAAVLAVLALSARDAGSVAPQAVVGSQSQPAAGSIVRDSGLPSHLDACGRPVVRWQASCR